MKHHINSFGMFVLVFIVLFSTSCSCPCTLQRCPDGKIEVTIKMAQGVPDACNEYCVPSVSWATRKEIGTVTQCETGIIDIHLNSIEFEIPGLEDGTIPDSTDSITLEVTCGDTLIVSGEYDVRWETYVCNDCGPCDPDMATTGHVDIML